MGLGVAVGVFVPVGGVGDKFAVAVAVVGVRVGDAVAVVVGPAIKISPDDAPEVAVAPGVAGEAVAASAAAISVSVTTSTVKGSESPAALSEL